MERGGVSVSIAALDGAPLPLQVISHLYELYGDAVANMLDGFFAFVLLDSRNNTFYAARDPLGVTCMYIGWGRDGSVWLSSEMKCLKVWGDTSVGDKGHCSRGTEATFSQFSDGN